MLVEKSLSKNTYVGKDGKEHHYVNYFLVCNNGRKIAITCKYKDDFKLLDMVSENVIK